MVRVKSASLRCLGSLLLFLLLLVAEVSCFTRRSFSDQEGSIEREFRNDYDSLEGIRMYKNPRNVPSGDCPRDEVEAHRKGRTCLRKCNSNPDCSSKKKFCLCDGICGMSCIKPDKECGELVNPMFGFVEVNGRVVGSKARYKCQKGYHLIGSEERVCQADGSWSRTPPECRENQTSPVHYSHADSHTLYCTDPPVISNAKHDSPEAQTRYEVNHTLKYTCDEGYETLGFSSSRCFLYNGTMQWFGPEIKCKSKSCGDPGDIENGMKEGACYKYSCQVLYRCRPGYELIGRADYYCQQDGTWSPRDRPTCKALQCDTPLDPKNGKVISTTKSFNYNSVVTYECEHGYMIVGPATRRCGPNKTWSEEEPQCKEINCGSPGHFSNGWIEELNGGTSFENSIKFECHPNMTLEGENTATCMKDGKWSNPLPKCLAPCIVPSIENGMINNTAPRQKVPHAFMLNITCYETYEASFGNTAPTCYNGTWSRYPRCEPARCKELPPRPRHGMVIAPKSEHGMKARFRCKDGYRLEGFDTTECHFGNWTGKIPTCKEVYCPFPGTVDHGRVLLVGNMGMYDYRDYVQKVKNNRQIRYKCDRGYYLVDGPPGATCVAGKWSPDKLPKCKPDLHPRMKWIRKRSVNLSKFMNSEEEYSPPGQTDKARARSNPLRLKVEAEFPFKKEIFWTKSLDSYEEETWRRKSKGKLKLNMERDSSVERENITIEKNKKIEKRKKRELDDKEERKRLRMERREMRKMDKRRKKGGKIFAHCDEITEEPFMKVEVLRQGRDDNYTFSSGARLKVICLHGYGLNIGNKTAKCARGRWKPMKPECFNLPCAVPATDHGEFNYNGHHVLQDSTISHGEVVKFSCLPGFNVIGSDTMRCWYGEWAVTGKNPECHPMSCILPDIMNGSYDSGYKQNLTIMHGSFVEYTCDPGFTKNVPDVTCHIGRLQPSGPQCVTTSLKTETIPVNVKRSEPLTAKTESLVASTESPDGRTYQDSELTARKNITYVGGITTEVNKSCPTPPIIPNTFAYKNGVPVDGEDSKFPEETNYTITCTLLFTTTVTQNERSIWNLRCENGTWVGRALGTCENGDTGDYGNKSCIWKKGHPKVVTFYNDQQLTDNRVELPPGAKIVSRCLDIGKYLISGSIINKCKNGQWAGAEPICHGLSQEHNYTLNKPPTILVRHMKGPIAQSNDGKLVVYPGTVLFLECLWVRRYGTPSWNVSQTITEFDPKKKKKRRKKVKSLKKKGMGRLSIDRKYPEGWTTDPKRNRQLEYRLSLYKAKKDDSGSYICTTPANMQHMIMIDVSAVHCPVVSKTVGLHLSPNSTKMGTVVSFTCDSGSMLVGPETIRCKPSGNWSAPLPHCERARCGSPAPPKNGRVEGKGPFRAGDMAHISCHPNFLMEGNRSIVCQQDGEWSGEVPKCLEACTYPGTIISGTMSSVMFYYRVGDVIFYNCSEGFVLDGSEEIKCLEGARWSGPVPSCKSKP